jgi:hypothetical protein
MKRQPTTAGKSVYPPFSAGAGGDGGGWTRTLELGIASRLSALQPLPNVGQFFFDCVKLECLSLAYFFWLQRQCYKTFFCP